MLTLPSRTLALAAAAAAACVVRPPLQTAPRAGPRDSVDEDTTCAGTTRADTRPSAAPRTIRMAIRATSTAPTPASARSFIRMYACPRALCGWWSERLVWGGDTQVPGGERARSHVHARTHTQGYTGGATDSYGTYSGAGGMAADPNSTTSLHSDTTTTTTLSYP